ncbi:MAG: fused MFS/spermidine synthase [Planctomycetota bacterium]|jgi:spermidine synthase/Flp pilus assembly protein TadD
MSKSKSFLSIVVPGATVFLSSGCIMVLEIVAGRLIARHLGSSLYTWTSVIGVVLAGITIGNYLGGRIADRFPARRALSALFGISSLTCVITVILNVLVGRWVFLWYMNWPLRVFTHVTLVFLIPSTLLGTISPVVAKMALDRGLPTGRTVGDIYACGAAGSIAGTFLAGFYLIAVMGTVAIIWMIGAVLLLMAILYWVRLRVLYAWAAVFFALMTLGVAPAELAQRVGSSFALRERPNPHVLYEDETQYNYIAVIRLSDKPEKRKFVQDMLTHSIMVMDNVRDLQYDYEQIYAAVTRQLSGDKDRFSVLAIGGGGYVFPRYIQEVWPGSNVDVVEIDPGVTKAAMEAFGLERDTTINIITMDARNYVNGLLEQQRIGKEIPRYDFIYEDAFQDCSVPYQLVTKEFNEKIARILTDDGVYMINLIEVLNIGLFIGSFVNTLEQTFPYVYVLTKEQESLSRGTFVLIAAKHEVNLDFGNLRMNESAEALDVWTLDDSGISVLKKKAGGIVLTDDYAPVENLLAPVVRQRAEDFILKEARELAEKLRLQGRLDKSIAMYREVLEVRPTVSIYREVAAMRIEQGRLMEAAEALQQAIRCSEQTICRVDISEIHLDLGLLLKQLQQPQRALGHFRKAVEGLRKQLGRSPDSVETTFKLGAALSELRHFAEAAIYLLRARDMDPLDAQIRLALAQTLMLQERRAEAIKQLRDDIRFMLDRGRTREAAELQDFLDTIERDKSVFIE